MRNMLIGGVVLLAVLGVISVTDSGSVLGVQTESEVRVAGLFNQTGFAAFAGEASKNGFTMAVEDAGLNPADFVIEDAQSDLTAAVSAAQKLTSVDEADIIIGPEWAEFGEVVVPVAESAGTLVVSPWMDSEFKWSQSTAYLSATPSVRSHVLAVLAGMHTSGVNRVALIASNNAWSNGVIQIVKDEVSIQYPAIEVVYESNPPENSNDYRTDLVKLKQSGAQAVFAVMASGTGEAYAQQSKELGILIPTYMPFSTVAQLQAGGKITTLFGVLFPSDVAYDRTEEFTAKYKARFGAEPSAISAATTYDMTTLVLQAIEDGAQDADDVREYLVNVKGYRGYSSVIEFGSDGHVVPGAVELRQVTATGSEVVQ